MAHNSSTGRTGAGGDTHGLLARASEFRVGHRPRAPRASLEAPENGGARHRCRPAECSAARRS
eukprot:7365495-Prymnesium_polylepis.1